MAFVPTTNAWEVKLRWVDAFKSFSNIIHVLSGGGSLDSGAAGLINTGVASAFAASGLNAVLNDSVALMGTTITDIRTEGAPQFDLAIGGSVGTSSTDLLPNGVAAVLTLRSAFRDKSGRGRMYLSGFAENANAVGGTINVTAAAAITQWGESLVAELTAAGFPLGVVSKAHNNAPLDPRVIREVTTTQLRDVQWDTQRRRQHTTS